MRTTIVVDLVDGQGSLGEDGNGARDDGSGGGGGDEQAT
jgi:hypothetical protein